MSKLNDAIVHSSKLPFNGTMLECDGDELRPDGTCAKCERVNQRLAARLQPAEDERVKEIRERERIWYCKNCGYKGMAGPAHEGCDEKAAPFLQADKDIDYLLSLLPVQPAQSNRQILSEMPDSQCAHSDWCNRWVGSRPRSYHPEIECSCGAAVQPAASTPTVPCDWCNHPSAYLPATLIDGKIVHVGRDNDHQLCTAAASTEAQNEKET